MHTNLPTKYGVLNFKTDKMPLKGLRRHWQGTSNPAWLLANSTTRWLVLGQEIVPTERISTLVIIHLFISSCPNLKFIFQALKLSSKDWVITMEMDVGIWEASDHTNLMIRLLNARNTKRRSFLHHTLSGPNNYTRHLTITTILTLTRQTLSLTFPCVPLRLPFIMISSLYSFSRSSPLDIFPRAFSLLHI